MQKLIFSSDDLPVELDDRARFARWAELYSDVYCAVDPYRIEDRPFSARFVAAQIGGAVVGSFQGALARLQRTPRHLAHDPTELLCISFNRSADPIHNVHARREAELTPGDALLLSTAELSTFSCRSNFNWTSLGVPRAKLTELLPHPEEMLLKPINAQQPTLRYLERYVAFVLEATPEQEPLVTEHVENALLDLVALTLGARRDAAELAMGRGLKAARRQDILAAIRKNFADPAFSSEALARKLGLSRRYINDLLAETGVSFTDRLLEARLQRAREMLANPRFDRLRIIEIAVACGFNDVSYFYRRFRARFGASPMDIREASERDRR